MLAGICLMGILTRLMTRNLYKKLLKECTNLTVTKNKGLKELKLRAENTYRMNQGLRDSGAVLMAMLTMVFDNGAISGRKEQLTSALQDYLENVFCPRLARNQPMDEPGAD